MCFLVSGDSAHASHRAMTPISSHANHAGNGELPLALHVSMYGTMTDGVIATFTEPSRPIFTLLFALLVLLFLIPYLVCATRYALHAPPPQIHQLRDWTSRHITSPPQLALA
jgi:hypothetical protein